MTFQLSPAEVQMLRLVPDKELAALAADLSLLPDEDIDRQELVEALLPRLLALGQREGLPFSKYDAEDLGELPSDHREALARAMGWSVDVRSMIKAGTKVYKKIYRRERTNSQVPLMLPLLLPMLARYASEVGSR
jgi:hypothetical protein